MPESKSPIYILGIETSCDETAVSVVKAGNNKIEVLSNVVSSQTKLHAKWGGVVPNLAAREHLKNTVPVLEHALKEARVLPANIDIISVTEGPGLIPALLIGVNIAKTLAYVWQKPLLGIHHIEGHIYANFIHPVKSREAGSPSAKFNRVKFPILCLVVSGGHTQLVLMKKHLDYKIVGETLDDAAGEAFDKVARILGLGYPGGPAIAIAADQYRLNAEKRGKLQRESASSPRESALGLPRPMINSNNLNFSFSGLKTAVLYETKKHSNILKNVGMKSALCAEFQQAVVDVLISKTLKAAEIYKPKTIMLAGGVSANTELRKQMKMEIQKNIPNSRFIIPNSRYCIDNAAMIAAAGCYRWKFMNNVQRKKTLNSWKTLQPDANLDLK